MNAIRAFSARDTRHLGRGRMCVQGEDDAEAREHEPRAVIPQRQALGISGEEARVQAARLRFGASDAEQSLRGIDASDARAARGGEKRGVARPAADVHNTLARPWGGAPDKRLRGRQQRPGDVLVGARVPIHGRRASQPGRRELRAPEPACPPHRSELLLLGGELE